MATSALIARTLHWTCSMLDRHKPKTASHIEQQQALQPFAFEASFPPSAGVPIPWMLIGQLILFIGRKRQ